MIQQTYDPDRIKVPMKRDQPPKRQGIDPKFVPISWDEALELMADQMIELRRPVIPKSWSTCGPLLADLHRSAVRNPAQDLRNRQLLLP